MRLVADAGALVAELPRTRGRALLTHSAIEWVASEAVADEVRHEIVRRTGILMCRHGLTADEGAMLARGALDLFASAILVVPQVVYAPFEVEARARLTDQHDWSSVALAFVLGAGIWTEDRDFCGIGLPTWNTRVLLIHLGLAE
jgi:predicted nucleic acid-binding protein